MGFQNKYFDPLNDRSSALERQKKLLQRSVTPNKASHDGPAASRPAQHKVAQALSKTAAVRLTGDCILTLTSDDCVGRHLAPALRECVDLYLQAAQCRTRQVALLWPGSLDSLPLIHAIATIEFWAQGYKKGLAAVLYPATTQSFWRLNHVFVDREEVYAMNSVVQEIAYKGPNPAVKDGCEQKDLMLFALNSLKAEAKAAGFQPCLNELLPHFFLQTGERIELAGMNYGNQYLGHLLSKLSKRRHAAELREKTLPKLGEPAVAPDAIFSLSYKMTKSQIENALRQIKALRTLDVVLLDATRIAFERVERLQNRVAAFVRIITEVFGVDAPGILVVTNDPRQMTLLRAALAREEVTHHVSLAIGRTRPLLLPSSGRGLQEHEHYGAIVLADAAISLEITDRESARLLVNAYRLSHEKGVPAALNEAIGRASELIRVMANLPAAAELLHKWLDDSMADDVQRRRFDWMALQNGVNGAIDGVDVRLRRKIVDWLKQATVVLRAQESGTPLARAMVDRIKARASAESDVLVIVQSRFYADLANEYFLRDANSEQFAGRVHFTALRMLKERLALNPPTTIIICALSPDLLRWIITTPTLPSAIDLLLTQQTALGAYHTLHPVISYPEFEPYFSRVRAIYEPIKAAQSAVGAVLPDFDYQTPAISLTVTNTSKVGGVDRGPSDYVDIELEDGRRLLRGRHARIYIYDPTAKESRSLGFRAITATAVKRGNQLFVMSEQMREQAEAAFARAGVFFDEASKYEQLLREYHAQVREHVVERFPGNLAVAVRAIRDGMEKANCVDDIGNIRYWINLGNADKTPYDELMPQAPRRFDTFKAFMTVLGFDETTIQVFWNGAVKRVRGTRISDGLNLGEHYDRVLFDPDAAVTYDGLTPDILNALRSAALDNVYEVTDVVFGTTSR